MKQDDNCLPVDSWEKVAIKPGIHPDIEDVLLAFNSNSKIVDYDINFQINRYTRRVTVTFPENGPIKDLTLSPRLCLQLGFEPFKPIFNAQESTYPVNILLSLPSQFLVYCDIIEPQIVGDVFAKLIRVVNVDNSKYMFGAQQMQIYSSLHYVPVSQREFENIEIDIRTNTGDPVPFQFGTVCVKLHFKRRL